MPFVSIISDVIEIYENFEKEEKFQQIKNTLSQIQKQINDVREELKNIPGQEHAIALYKQNSQIVFNLNKAFEKYSKTANNVTRLNFIKECNSNSMANYFNYLEK